MLCIIMRRKTRRNHGDAIGTESRMNDETFKLRRKVMSFVYDAKNLLERSGKSLPRIKVRITDGQEHHFDGEVGMAYLNNLDIYIPKHSFKYTDNEIRGIVFHEIVHAATGFRHDQSCKLMHTNMQTMTNGQMDKLFVKYF